MGSPLRMIEGGMQTMCRSNDRAPWRYFYR
jgi:hypothetical protein